MLWPQAADPRNDRGLTMSNIYFVHFTHVHRLHPEVTHEAWDASATQRAGRHRRKTREARAQIRTWRVQSPAKPLPPPGEAPPSDGLAVPPRARGGWSFGPGQRGHPMNVLPARAGILPPPQLRIGRRLPSLTRTSETILEQAQRARGATGPMSPVRPADRAGPGLADGSGEP